MLQNQSNNPESNFPAVDVALENLRFHVDMQNTSMERAFIEALQGKPIDQIGRYQVYTDYRENESVVFIHDPTGRDGHKYIFAETADHTYIVAAPLNWTDYHYKILNRVTAASGEEASCPGGGWVSVGDDGVVNVNRSSGDFGPGDHPRAKKAFEDAVRKTAERQGAH